MLAHLRLALAENDAFRCMVLGCTAHHDQCGRHSSAQHNAPALLVAYEQEPEEKLSGGAARKEV